MRVMVATCPLLSHAYPMVPLAWALRLTGHDVVFAAGGTATAVVDAGLPVMDPVPGFVVDQLGDERLTAPPGTRTDPEREPVVRMNVILAEGLAEAVRSWRPDVVVYDPLAPVAALVAVRSGIPTVRHAITLEDASDLLGAVPDMVAERIGAPLPGTVPGDPLITFAPPSLEGACHGDWPVRGVPFNGGQVVPDWLRTSPQGPQAAPHRPMVLVTRGSMPMSGETSSVKSVVDIAGDVDADFLLLPGSDDSPDSGALPDNVRKVGWTALSELLPLCDAIVHHGGAGTTVSALHFGVPQLIVPNGVDRARNAELVDQRGAGIRAAPEELDVHLVHRLVTDPGMRAAAGQVREEMARMPSPVDLVPKLAALVG